VIHHARIRDVDGRSVLKFGGSLRSDATSARRRGMSTLTVKLEPIATELRVDDAMLHVLLADGRELSVPLAWYPKLAAATPKQRANFRLVGRGVGINWPDLDEDLSVLGMLVGANTRAA